MPSGVFVGTDRVDEALEVARGMHENVIEASWDQSVMQRRPGPRPPVLVRPPAAARGPERGLHAAAAGARRDAHTQPLRHVIDELEEAPRLDAEAAIRAVRRESCTSSVLSGLAERRSSGRVERRK